MYCIVLSMMLFSKGEWIRCFIIKNLQAIGYHVPPSADTGCFPWIFITLEMNLSATNMFLSLDMDNERICLFFGSIATQSHMCSEPTLISVSSIMYPVILFLFVETFWGWYFWIQFQMETWFRLKIRDNLSDALLSDRPEKYKCNPYPTYFEGVLFLVFIKEIEHLQAIGLPLSGQSHAEPWLF